MEQHGWVWILVNAVFICVCAFGVRTMGRQGKSRDWRVRWTVALVLAVALLAGLAQALGVLFRSNAVPRQAWGAFCVFVGWLACAWGFIRAVACRRTGTASPPWLLLVPLVGLLLFIVPEINCAREAARRSQCRRNLAGIGVALHAYHDVYGCFPAAIVTDGQGTPAHSWTVLLLPFLDRMDLYSQYNFSVAHDHPANDTVSRTRVDQFVCPSCRYTTDSAGYPLVHYGMVASSGSVGGADRYVRLADITDGVDHTLVVVERYDPLCRWTAPRAIVDPTRGFCTDGTFPPGISSAHEGGAFVLLAGGEARWMFKDIDSSTLRALCSISGGDKVDPDRF